MWAGPERFSRAMLAGEQAVTGTVRSGPVRLRLGFAADDLGYAITLGLPIPSSSRFVLDPEIRHEAVWNGARLRPAILVAERKGAAVRLRDAQGQWHARPGQIGPVDSMMTQYADATDGLELLLLRERMRGWRFYDALRTDRTAPARRPQVGTYTPVLAHDGSDFGAALRPTGHCAICCSWPRCCRRARRN